MVQVKAIPRPGTVRNAVSSVVNSSVVSGPMAFLFLCICLLSSAAPLFAQSELQRISAVERSDGKGFVLRHHLSAAVDSFKVVQPQPDLIQVILYAGRLTASDVLLPDRTEIFQRYRLYPLPMGYGVEIQMGNDSYYSAAAYPDQNGKDLLVALTETPPQLLAAVTAGVEKVSWTDLSNRLMSSLLVAAEQNTAVERDANRDEAEAEIVQAAVTNARSAVDLIANDEGYLAVRENLRFDTVVLDPGHGGGDPGTVGSGLLEKDIALSIAKKVGGYIEASKDMQDVKVVYTREDDRYIDLEVRGQIANQARGDLFVSIHANALDPTTANRRVQGTEVWILGPNKTEAALEVMKRENTVVRPDGGEDTVLQLSETELLNYEMQNFGNIALSERIAGMIDKEFSERAGRRSRGVKQNIFVVLYHASMPAVLVETGFISNSDEARYLASDYGQNLIASAIFRAIRDYKVEYERSRDLTSNEN